MSLAMNDRDKVTKVPSHIVFKLGGGEQLQSEETFKIPANTVGEDIFITTDIFDSDIVLLL